MPKCEMCADKDGNPNLIKRVGSTGWCKIHKCARYINDSCQQGEIDAEDYWGER